MPSHPAATVAGDPRPTPRARHPRRHALLTRRAGIFCLWLAATLLAPVWREPWLVSTWGRQAFGAVLLGSMAVLFATTELRRIKAIEFGTMVLLAPLVFTLFAFYRAPEKPPTGDARVRFLYSSTDAKAPARVRRGDDLRFAARDCRGRLLLGGASSPGLEILDGRSAVLDPAPTGDNLLPICVGRPGLAYGARDGSVIWQGDDGERKTFAMGQPVLMVQYDPRRDLIFAMNRLTRLVSLRLSDFDLVAQHAGGVSIDILYSPEQDVLYRSVFLRGVETLEPQTLEVIGVRELPLSVGGTMAVDPAHRRLFLTDWLGGTLYVLDARDLTPAAELPADHGMRRVVFDRQRELLLAGSYFRGDVLVYRPNIGGPPLRLHVGRRVRELALDGDRCLGVSAAGVFALDLNAIARGFGR